MSLIHCRACRRVIDIDPPACPACGVQQTRPLAPRLIRLSCSVIMTLSCFAVGVLIGDQLSRTIFNRASVMESNAAAMIAACPDRLQAELSKPYAPIEDALLEPGRFLGESAQILGYANDYLPNTQRLLLSADARHRATNVHVDLSGLAQPAKERSTSFRGWITLRGHWVASVGDPEHTFVRRHPIEFAAQGIEFLGDGCNDVGLLRP